MDSHFGKVQKGELRENTHIFWCRLFKVLHWIDMTNVFVQSGSHSFTYTCRRNNLGFSESFTTWATASSCECHRYTYTTLYNLSKTKCLTLCSSCTHSHTKKWRWSRHCKSQAWQLRAMTHTFLPIVSHCCCSYLKKISFSNVLWGRKYTHRCCYTRYVLVINTKHNLFL